MIKKPLVITSGKLQQLKDQDVITCPRVLEVNNGEAVTTKLGAAVYISSTDTIKFARADVAGTMKVIAMCHEVIAVSGIGLIQVSGLLILTTAQWDIVTGDSGGLTPGAMYFLSTTLKGRITKTVPTTGFMVKMGIAVSPTKFEISIGTPIKL